jgi:hypothetical protein
MSERRKVWGLYMWGSGEWWVGRDGKKRMRFDTPQKAFQKIAELVRETGDDDYTTGIRPFYIVSKKRTKLDPKVQAVVDAARIHCEGYDEKIRGWHFDFVRLVKAVRAFDGK